VVLAYDDLYFNRCKAPFEAFGLADVTFLKNIYGRWHQQCDKLHAYACVICRFF